MSNVDEDRTTNTAFPDLPSALRAAIESRPEHHPVIRFSSNKWQELIDVRPELTLDLSELDGSIRRDELVTLAKQAIDNGRHGDAFTLTMIWGYGPAGYGPSRVSRILDSEPPKGADDALSVLERLAQTGSLARSGTLSQKADASYRYINRGKGSCKYFGPSFFTKWLYVASADGVSRAATALPILDEVTRRYVNRHASTFDPIRVRYTDDYVRYVELLSHWAGQAGDATSAVDVEEAIFAIAR